MTLISLADLYEYVFQQLGQFQSVRSALVGYRTNTLIGDDNHRPWDTPHGCWSGGPSVERGHSEWFVGQIKDAIGQAERVVDITTMKFPTGKFWEAIKAGLVELAGRGKPIDVRILIGQPHNYNERLRPMLEDIQLALANRPRVVRVDLGKYQFLTSQAYPEAWNHSKIIAVDGKTLITGGHNLWAEHYLGDRPVFDVSMKVQGPVAEGGHAFANHLWKFIHDWHGQGPTDSYRLNRDGTITRDKPLLNIDPSGPTGPGNLRAMWVTNSGRGVFKRPDGTEIVVSSMVIAFLKALESASHCRISQQSFGSLWVNWSGANFEVFNHGSLLPFPVIYHFSHRDQRYHAFDYRIMKGLADFLDRHKDAGGFVLEILMAPPDAKDAYCNGEADVAILDILAHICQERWKLTRQQIVDRLNRLVRLNWPAFTPPGEPPKQAVRHWGANPEWPMATHAKFWMMDDCLAYVGSENMYPCLASQGLINAVGGLQEFGVVLEDAGSAPTLKMLLVERYHALAMGLGFRRVLVGKDLTSPRIPFGGGDMIAIKASNGKYLSRVRDDRDYLKASKDRIDDFCLFQVFAVAGGGIALKGDRGAGKFLRRSYEGYIEPDGDAIGARSTFSLEEYDGGSEIRLKADQGGYFALDDDDDDGTYRIYLSRERTSDNNKFFFEHYRAGEGAEDSEGLIM